MREFSQATEILALLERGDLANDFSNEIRRVIGELQERAGAKGSASGSITLTLNFKLDEGVKLEIQGDIKAKTPPAPRAKSWMFVTPNATISMEHPSQRDMFTRDITEPKRQEA